MSEQVLDETIPITSPVLDESEEQAIIGVLRSGWLVQGPRVAEFEDKFKTFLGVKHAIATTSCTTALHLALLAAGIGQGDEVLLPSFTFVATANAVEYTGAKPVFIDIDPTTYTVDPEKIEAYLGNRRADSGLRPKCIIPVSLFGLCADMKAINKIATEHGLIVIEDAACGLGAERQWYRGGTEALAGCFSFHPRKALTTGEGGMVVTNDDGLADKARKLRDHGASKTDLDRHLEKGGSLLPEYSVLGFNYRMTDLQGALGVAQMSKADMILEGRREAASRYDRLLKGTAEIRKPFVPEGYTHAYQSYVCLYKADFAKPKDKTGIDWGEIQTWNKERNRLMSELERNGISVRQGTHAVHTLAYYNNKYGFNDYDYPMSYIADRLSITLPLYYGMTASEQHRVVTCLTSILNS
jgi:dTDP-4-amino-4,6-dideoxygalactose transaminase